MVLKCPICGEKYYYDRKICHECEDKMKINKCKSWNCGMFLDSNNSIFNGIKIDSEPKMMGINIKEYGWNPFSSKNIMFE